MNGENMDTKPTIETVLVRINEIGANLEKRIGGLETRMGALETAVTDLREEVHRGFRRVERRFEVLSGDMLKLRTDLGYMLGPVG